MKITMKAQREKRERKAKTSFSIAKKNLVRSLLFMTSTKKSTNRTSSLPTINKHSILVYDLPIFGRS